MRFLVSFLIWRRSRTARCRVSSRLSTNCLGRALTAPGLEFFERLDEQIA
jgi:hypothetical protein